MKNSQVAVLSVVILVAAVIVAGSNYLLVRSVADGLGAARSGPAGGAGPPDRNVTIAMMPKSKGNAYFIACQRGAEEAAGELGVDLIWDGPTDPDPAKRPASALSVAAALPGSDPLAAALAAGETPSPELVAAAGETEGMARRYSVPLLIVVVACLCGFMIWRQHTDAMMRTTLDLPPQVPQTRFGISRKLHPQTTRRIPKCSLGAVPPRAMTLYEEPCPTLLSF